MGPLGRVFKDYLSGHIILIDVSSTSYKGAGRILNNNFSLDNFTKLEIRPGGVI